MEFFYCKSWKLKITTRFNVSRDNPNFRDHSKIESNADFIKGGNIKYVYLLVVPWGAGDEIVNSILLSEVGFYRLIYTLQTTVE